MFLERVLLLDVPICDVADYQVDLLEGVTRVLQLLTRLCILLVDVLRHEVFPLLLRHRLESLNFSRLNHVVIPNLLDVEEYLCALAMFFGQVLVHVVYFAGLSDAGHLAGFVSCESLLLTVARLVVEEPLRVSVPSHRLHVQDVPSHIFVMPVSMFVFLGDV